MPFPRSTCPCYTLCSIALNVMCGLGIVLALSFGEAVAGSFDEEQIVERDVVFTVPGDLADTLRSRAELAGHAYLFGLSLLGGHDDNVHHSPELLARSSSAFENWFYGRSDARFGKRVRLLNTLNWKQTVYKSETPANFRRGSLSNWLEIELSSRWKVSADFDINAENDDATLITGQQYTRDYSFWKYAGELMATWQASKSHQFRFGAEGTLKNYGEVPGFTSYDWNQLSWILRYRYRVSARHYVKLGYTSGKRDYTDNLASLLVDGSEPPSNPTESHRYHELRFGYEVPVVRGLDLSLDYYLRGKKDLFEGYEDWSSREFHAWVGIRPSRRIELTSEISALKQSYDHLPSDNGQTVDYTRVDFRAGGRFALSREVRLSGSVGHLERSSNVESGLYFRDYSGLTVTLGVSLFLLP